jgi:hypothetical protein
MKPNKIISIIFFIISIFFFYLGYNESSKDYTKLYTKINVKVSNGEIISRRVESSTTRLGGLRIVTTKKVYDIYGIYSYIVNNNTFKNKYKISTVNSFSEADYVISKLKLNPLTKTIYYEKSRPYKSQFSVKANNSVGYYIGGTIFLIIALTTFFSNDLIIFSERSEPTFTYTINMDN